VFTFPQTLSAAREGQGKLLVRPPPPGYQRMAPPHPMKNRFLILLPLCVALSARAQLAVSTNDAHAELVDGVNTVPKNPRPDTLAVIDLSVSPPKLVAEIAGVPGSVIGPPFSVAVTPDEHYALVTACMKVDPADPTKTTADNRLTVVDLKASPPRVIATLTTGQGPAGVAINRAGTLALVANRGDGTISIFSINGATLTPQGTLMIGNATSALGTVAITPDGQRALVSRDGDNLVSVLNIDGMKVTLAGRDVRTGLRPYGVDITRDGHYAVVGNVGYGNGDTDTIALLDLRADPVRVVDIAPVPQTPEGIKLSPDGALCAVIAQDGSNKPKDSPFYHDHGQLVLFRLSDGKFAPLAHAPIGHWSQGAAFSADGRTIIAGNMVEKNIQVFSWDGQTLRDTGVTIPLQAGSAAISTAWK
jgi:DNA-binding beta-propeller fold protein YncE